MLALSRSHEEWLCIGDNIYLKVLGISENQVRIGIKAPPETVHREEVVFALKSTRPEYPRSPPGVGSDFDSR